MIVVDESNLKFKKKKQKGHIMSGLIINITFYFNLLLFVLINFFLINFSAKQV